VKIIALSDIRRIIRREILEEVFDESLPVSEEDGSNFDSTDNVDSTALESSYTNDTFLRNIGKHIFDVLEAMKMQAESDSASEDDIEFFKELMSDAHAAAEKFPQTESGMVGSILAAANFFEINADKFPPGIQDKVDKVINFTPDGFQDSTVA